MSSCKYKHGIDAIYGLKQDKSVWFYCTQGGVNIGLLITIIGLLITIVTEVLLKCFHIFGLGNFRDRLVGCPNVSTTNCNLQKG